MKWFRLGLPFRIFGLLFLCFLIWQVAVFVKPRPRPFTPPEIRAVELACDKAASALTTNLNIPSRFGVAHFIGDPYDNVTESMRVSLAGHPGWTVEKGSVIEKFLEDVMKAAGGATSLEEITKAGQRVELDVIVAGRVLSVDTSNGTSRASIQVLAYDTRPSQWLTRDTFEATWKPTFVEKTLDGVRQSSPLTRLLIWLAFVALLPWATAFATQWALERKSNFTSFIVVSAYTVIDLAAALALTGFSVAGGGPWLKFLTAFAVAAGYNFWACERIAECET
ncbi:MAG: hypothetical protein V1929_12610 [bacterium]